MANQKYTYTLPIIGQCLNKCEVDMNCKATTITPMACKSKDAQHHHHFTLPICCRMIVGTFII